MGKDIEQIVDFLHRVENLKSTLRYCHTTTGRKESSAEHSWRLALMVFMAAEGSGIKIDMDRAMRMALVHDIAEAITGDIDFAVITEGRMTKKEKQDLEIKAINELAGILPEKRGEEIKSLWEEYEDGKTDEARFVKALDKIETLLQIGEMGYEKYDKPELIGIYGNKEIKNCPELLEMMRQAKNVLKVEFEKGNIPWGKEYEI